MTSDPCWRRDLHPDILILQHIVDLIVHLSHPWMKNDEFSGNEHLSAPKYFRHWDVNIIVGLSANSLVGSDAPHCGPSKNWHEEGQDKSSWIGASYAPPFSSKKCHFPWLEIEYHRGTLLNYYFAPSTSIAVHSSICLYQCLSSHLEVHCKS